MSTTMLGRLARGITLCGLAAATAGSLTNTTLRAQAQPSPQPIIAEQAVSVNFQGGTLADYLAAVRSAGQSLNIVAPGEANQVAPLPPITLVNAPVSSALDAVTTIVDRRRFEVTVRTLRTSPLTQIVYSVAVAVAPHAENMLSEPRQVKVFSLRGLTESGAKGTDGSAVLPAQTVLVAIDTGLALATEDGEKPVIKYHSDSGLLFVRATSAQLSVVAQALERLHEDLIRQQSAQQSAQDPAPAGRTKGTGR